MFLKLQSKACWHRTPRLKFSQGPRGIHTDPRGRGPLPCLCVGLSSRTGRWERPIQPLVLEIRQGCLGKGRVTTAKRSPQAQREASRQGHRQGAGWGASDLPFSEEHGPLEGQGNWSRESIGNLMECIPLEGTGGGARVGGTLLEGPLPTKDGLAGLAQCRGPGFRFGGGWRSCFGNWSWGMPAFSVLFCTPLVLLDFVGLRWRMSTYFLMHRICLGRRKTVPTPKGVGGIN